MFSTFVLSILYHFVLATLINGGACLSFSTSMTVLPLVALHVLALGFLKLSLLKTY